MTVTIFESGSRRQTLPAYVCSSLGNRADPAAAALSVMLILLPVTPIVGLAEVIGLRQQS
ncbi:MAG: hypothetical protein ACREFO_02250 [Acetobacteraceae bacterium]